MSEAILIVAGAITSLALVCFACAKSGPQCSMFGGVAILGLLGCFIGGMAWAVGL